jgi:hypothetical protein
VLHGSHKVCVFTSLLQDPAQPCDWILVRLETVYVMMIPGGYHGTVSYKPWYVDVNRDPMVTGLLN